MIGGLDVYYSRSIASAYSKISREQETTLAKELDYIKHQLQGNNGTKQKKAKLALRLREIREILVNSQLPWVVSIARRYSSNDNLEDLSQEGNQALLKTVNDFDYERGNRLCTAAREYIRIAILHYLKRNMSRVQLITSPISQCGTEEDKDMDFFSDPNTKKPEDEAITNEMKGYRPQYKKTRR